MPLNSLHGSNCGLRLFFMSVGVCTEVEGRGEGADESSSAASPNEGPPLHSSNLGLLEGPWLGLHWPSGHYMGPHGCSSTLIVTK